MSEWLRPDITAARIARRLAEGATEAELVDDVVSLCDLVGPDEAERLIAEARRRPPQPTIN